MDIRKLERALERAGTLDLPPYAYGAALKQAAADDKCARDGAE